MCIYIYIYIYIYIKWCVSNFKDHNTHVNKYKCPTEFMSKISSLFYNINEIFDVCKSCSIRQHVRTDQMLLAIDSQEEMETFFRFF